MLFSLDVSVDEITLSSSTALESYVARLELDIPAMAYNYITGSYSGSGAH